MATVGEQLRRAREAQNLTIHQVAELTKIRTDHLRAIEEGRYDVFAAPVYIRGFARSYATTLKLNANALMTALDAELSQSPKFREAPALGDRPRTPLDWLMLQLSRVHWRMALPAVILAGVIVSTLWGVKAWRSHRARDPLSGLGPGLYHPPTATNAAGGELIPLPPPPAPPPGRR